MQATAVANSPRLRLVQLDLLRAIALMLVLGRHKFGSTFWDHVGWIGVDLFFVLSGFLVGGLLFSEYQKKGKIDFKTFFIRRGLRVYLPFYLLILVTVIVQFFLAGFVDIRRVLAEVLFVQNYFPGLWNHTWYLGVDQQFYLGLAIALSLMCRFSPNQQNPFQSIIPLFMGISTLLLLLQGWTALVVPYHITTHIFPTHLRLDSPLFGVVIAYYYHFHHAALTHWVTSHLTAIFWGSWALLFPAMVLTDDHFFMHTLGIKLLYLGFGGLLLFTLYWQPKLPESVEQVINPAIATVGAIGLHSYSIYLWHMPVARWGSQLLKTFVPYPVHYMVEFCLYIIGSIFLGVVLSHLVEIPILKLRDKLYPSRFKNLKDKSTG
jgi:peptidoglycan/LPS O-acetylase OafA/YrhL